ncbi:MAG: metallophosphoesterase [Gemmatimonadales bacterium]|nr:MAG: metallophosphoesterase [Gemmatimonadales bacterium]
MKIGILSDTHGLLRPEVFPALEGVEHILHAGDVGDPDILLALEALAPVTAVHGNTDGWEIRSRLPEAASVELEGLRFTVVHGHLASHGTTPRRLSRIFPGSDVVVFGHTHQPLLVETEPDTETDPDTEGPGVGGGEVRPRWFVNPGSCGPHRFRLPVSLVRAEIRKRRFFPELIHLVHPTVTESR